MDGEAVTDLILRAIAAMRERGDLPEIETPRFTVIRVTGASTDIYRSNAGQTLAAAQTGDAPKLTPGELAAQIAEYLAEVVDLVPAYHDFATVSATDAGDLIFTLRPHETR